MRWLTNLFTPRPMYQPKDFDDLVRVVGIEGLGGTHLAEIAYANRTGPCVVYVNKHGVRRLRAEYEYKRTHP